VRRLQDPEGWSDSVWLWDQEKISESDDERPRDHVRSRSKVPRREPCELEGPEHCVGRGTDEILTDSSLASITDNRRND